MAPQEIKKLFSVEPFIPLRLHLANGSHYDVHSPSDVIIGLLSLTIGVDPDESGLFRDSVYISPNHVSHIQSLSESAKVGGNGRSQPSE